ncbi:MAG: hypothetical protein Q7U89_01675 [Coriobacteriia bacterium]|nr:hypothetical protein [Coriobacteriia bacterium]
MQFVIKCPVDGPIEVSVEDIDTVVLREPEQAEVVFSCPECGAEISVIVQIPSFLMAAIEAMASDTDSYVAPLASLVAMAAQAKVVRDEVEPVVIPPAHLQPEDHDRIDSYCEYFRRQLARVDDVQDALRELGVESE